MISYVRSCVGQVRKDHKCYGCKRIIKKGETATMTVNAGEGSIYTTYECKECIEYIQNVCDKCSDRMDCICDNYYEGTIRECKHNKEDNNV